MISQDSSEDLYICEKFDNHIHFSGFNCQGVNCHAQNLIENFIDKTRVGTFK